MIQDISEEKQKQKKIQIQIIAKQGDENILQITQELQDFQHGEDIAQVWKSLFLKLKYNGLLKEISENPEWMECENQKDDEQSERQKDGKQKNCEQIKYLLDQFILLYENNLALCIPVNDRFLVRSTLKELIDEFYPVEQENKRENKYYIEKFLYLCESFKKHKISEETRSKRMSHMTNTMECFFQLWNRSGKLNILTEECKQIIQTLPEGLKLKIHQIYKEMKQYNPKKILTEEQKAQQLLEQYQQPKFELQDIKKIMLLEFEQVVDTLVKVQQPNKRDIIRGMMHLFLLTGLRLNELCNKKIKVEEDKVIYTPSKKRKEYTAKQQILFYDYIKNILDKYFGEDSFVKYKDHLDKLYLFGKEKQSQQQNIQYSDTDRTKQQEILDSWSQLLGKTFRLQFNKGFHNFYRASHFQSKAQQMMTEEQLNSDAKNLIQLQLQQQLMNHKGIESTFKYV